MPNAASANAKRANLPRMERNGTPRSRHDIFPQINFCKRLILPDTEGDRRWVARMLVEPQVHLTRVRIECGHRDVVRGKRNRLKCFCQFSRARIRTKAQAWQVVFKSAAMQSACLP